MLLISTPSFWILPMFSDLAREGLGPPGCNPLQVNLPTPHSLVDWLSQQFPEAHLLVVGGSVRDALRGHPSKDLDLEVVGVDPNAFLAALPWPHKTVGRSFSHQLVLLDELGWVELTLEEQGFAEWEQLCRRRDFTCNAIAWDPLRQRLLDPLGGQQHIGQRLLVEASPSSISQDPLRIWRAAQFCARFNWSVRADLRQTIEQNLPALVNLPAERVTREWEKVLVLPERPSMALERLDEWGVIGLCYPELQALHDCPQDPLYHPEGDVWIHTLMVVDQAAALSRQRRMSPEERLQMVLAALLHDVGKPATTRCEGERVTAHGHENAGLKPAAEWLQRHCFGEVIGLAVLDCVGRHMRPGQLTKDIENGRLSPSQQVNALRRLVRDLEHVSWDVFIGLCEADKRGRGETVTDYPPGRVLGALLQAHPVLEMAQATLLQGRDLLELGLSPGPEMGQWIRRVEEARDEGQLATREEAVAWVRERL
jgi:tRNA nucleotidyltransferase (CCA-adding enzyme)